MKYTENKMSETINVEVVYSKPEQQDLVELSLAVNATVKQAIDASGLLDKHPEIDLDINKVGIFKKLVSLDTTLKTGDRVSIFRELILSPNEARLLRAKKLKEKNK